VGKKRLGWALAVLLAAAGAAAGLGLRAFPAWLKGSLATRLERSTGRPVSIGSAQFHLDGTLVLERLELGAPRAVTGTGSSVTTYAADRVTLRLPLRALLLNPGRTLDRLSADAASLEAIETGMRNN
jgi:hypothetical protein